MQLTTPGARHAPVHQGTERCCHYGLGDDGVGLRRGVGYRKHA
jgi:hypothetical protein